MAISTEQRQQAIQQFRMKDTDSGSSAVQISLLTQRINQLTEHMRTNTKDYSSRRGLLRLVSKRRGLLDYVRRHDPQRYLDIIQRLGIRK
jgi:small subunit ribosomal protein S15